MSRLSVSTVLLLFLATPSVCFAYLDPGTGSMILQGLLAAIALAAVTLKDYWQRFLALFRRSAGPEEEGGQNATEQQDN